MSKVRYPSISVPFASEINPFVQDAERHCREFAGKHGLLPTFDDERHFDETLNGTLVSRTSPRADRETIELLAAWMGTNLILDDLFDETDLGEDPKRLREYCDRVLSWWPESGRAEAASEDSPLARAYAELWERTSARTTRAWRRRFREHFALFFDGCVWEAENRSDGAVPTVDEYVEIRARALMPYIDFIELVTPWEVPADLYGTPVFGELNRALSECVLWTNDLYSCEKEHLLGDVHNFAVVLAATKGMELQEAADVLGAKIGDRIDDFVRVSTDVIENMAPRQGDGVSRAVLVGHVENMRSWLSGQMRWRFETRRNDSSKLAVTNGRATRTYL
ncbi:hypothetical protein [Allokutzneria sp. NRRL B-24872]|uniref:terpene synthase family protein n=1 Tax=Allokutzneria sp. NRRL B-24872 TaxID=1137961 RepID=UPI000A392DF3|nr:hypothetical protein [Allokutzneria sp. NRRL B-24872]